MKNDPLMTHIFETVEENQKIKTEKKIKKIMKKRNVKTSDVAWLEEESKKYQNETSKKLQ